MTRLEDLMISRGRHEPDEGGACTLEIAALLRGEPMTDRPGCVPASLAAFTRPLTDWLEDGERQVLLPFTVRLGLAEDSVVLERERGFAFADFAVRTVAPVGLAAAGFPERADELRGLAPVTDEASAKTAASAAYTVCADIGAAVDYAAAGAASAAYTVCADIGAAVDYAAAGAARVATAADVDGAPGVRSVLVAECVGLLDRLCPRLPADLDGLGLRWDRVAHLTHGAAS